MRIRVSVRRRRRSRRFRSSSRGTTRTERAPGAWPRELDRLNVAYEARFGFRYCVFVAGRSREALLPGFIAALEADREAEIAPSP